MSIQRHHDIVVGTASEFKKTALRSAVPGALAILGIAGNKVELLFPKEKFHTPELGRHEYANAEEKALAVHQEGRDSFGWDIGLQIDALGGPGPFIKRIPGFTDDTREPTSLQVYEYYRDILKEIPEKDRRGYLNYAMCLVDANGKAFFTTCRYEVRFDINAPPPKEGINPLDTMMRLDVFSKPYSELDKKELKEFDNRLSRGMLSLVQESEEHEQDIDSRRSYTQGNKVWVFSQDNPQLPIRLCQAEDKDGVNGMSNSLNKYYDGLNPGWAWALYGTMDRNKRADPNGHHTVARDLIVMGNVGEAIAQCSLVEKSSGCTKINTWVVNEQQRGKGHGDILLREIVDMGKALGIRKMYATSASDGALHLFEKHGFKVEAKLPNQYKEGVTETVIGKLLIPPRDEDAPDKSVHMMDDATNESVIEKTETVTPADSSAILALLNRFNTWQNGIDLDYIERTHRGAERGFDDIEGKGKYFIGARDSQGILRGVAAATLKRGGLVKIYPIAGTNEAQEKMIRDILVEAKKREARVLNVFSPVWDTQQATFFESIGLTKRGKLISSFKQGADMYQWTGQINTLLQ